MNVNQYSHLINEFKEAIANKDYDKAVKLNDKLYELEYGELNKWKGIRSVLQDDLAERGVKFLIDPQRKISNEEKAKLEKELEETNKTIRSITKELNQITDLGIFLSQNTPELNQGEEK